MKFNLSLTDDVLKGKSAPILNIDDGADSAITDIQTVGNKTICARTITAAYCSNWCFNRGYRYYAWWAYPSLVCCCFN